MALMITETCTACDACEPVCPNKAISVGDPIYIIDPLKCTECVGAEDEPQCKLVCPAECIVPNPDWVETQDGPVGQVPAVAWLMEQWTSPTASARPFTTSTAKRSRSSSGWSN